MGKIYLDKLNLPDSAEVYFRDIITRFPRSNFKEQAGLALGKCAIIKGELDAALNRYRETSRVNIGSKPEIKAEAILMIGRCLCWKGEIDSALAVWENLARVQPMLGEIGDWRRYLALDVEEEEAARMRRHERTGRPLGSEGFIERLENRLGRLLRKRKPGPRPGRKSELSKMSP